MTLTTRENVIEAGYEAIKSGGNKNYMTALENRVKEYRNQKKSIGFAIEVNFWWENLERNFSTMTIEKFNDSLSNLP